MVGGLTLDLNSTNIRIIILIQMFTLEYPINSFGVNVYRSSSSGKITTLAQMQLL